MPELNPNHPVTQEVRDMWYKICAVVLFKTGSTQMVITADDIARFENSGVANIVVHPVGDVFTVSLVSDREAARLVKKEGGQVV